METSNALSPLNWVRRLLVRHDAPATPPRPPVDDLQALDRLLVILARPHDHAEPVRLFVHRMSVDRADFRCGQLLPVGQGVRFDMLLDTHTGVRCVDGVVSSLEKEPGGFAGRLDLRLGAFDRRDLERWLRKRVRNLSTPS